MNIALSTEATPQPNNIPTSTQTIIEQYDDPVEGMMFVIETSVVEL